MTAALVVSHTGEQGGAELFLVELVSAGPADWQACFLSDGAAAETLRRAGRPPIMLEAGQKMLSVRRNTSIGGLVAAAGDVFAAARQLSRHARRFDVLCANSQKSLFVCALAAMFAHKPLVWFLHDIITDPAFSSANRRAALVFSKLFVSRVAVNSEETGRAFIAAGGQRDKIRLIYNGFDPDAFTPSQPEDANALVQSLGLDPAKPVVGLFGRLSEWKGQHVLLDALAGLDNVQAIIVGAPLFGQEPYEKRIREQATRLGLDGRVRFLGFRKDVQGLMSVCTAVVHTSIAAEPFGRVVVEGLLAGRPVIATQGGGVTEIIRDGSTGLLVPPDNAPALAMAIARLTADHALAERLAQAGRADAAERFSMASTLQSFARLLAEMA